MNNTVDKQTLTFIKHCHNLQKTIAKLIDKKNIFRRIKVAKFQEFKQFFEIIKNFVQTTEACNSFSLILYFINKLVNQDQIKMFQQLKILIIQKCKQAPSSQSIGIKLNKQQKLSQICSSNCFLCQRVFYKTQQSIKTLAKTQENRPFFIVGISQLFKEDLQKMLCVIANSNNSFILVAYQCTASYKIQGFRRISLNDQKTILNLCTEAYKSILPRNRVKIKIYSVQLKENIQYASHQCSQKQWLIKVHVNARPQKQKIFFHIQHRLQSIRSSYHFFKANKSMHGIYFSANKIQGTDIYNQIKRVACARNETGNIHSCDHSCEFFQNQQLQICSCLNASQTVTEQKPNHSMKKKYLNLFNKKQFFKSCCQIFYKQDFHLDFMQIIKQDQQYIAFQLSQSGKQKKILNKIISLFDESGFKYRFFEPMPQFQKQLNQFKKVQSSTPLNYLTIYCLAIQGCYIDTKQKVNKKFSEQQKQTFIMEPISQKISTGISFTQKQLSVLYELLSDKFKIIPKVQKVPLQMPSNELTFRQVEIQFSKSDLNIAMYTYILLLFSKKRPLCLF